MLLSSGQIRLKCDLQKFGENGMIHGQQAFEKIELNMFIAMSIVLNQNRPQIQSCEVRACKCNDSD